MSLVVEPLFTEDDGTAVLSYALRARRMSGTDPMADTA